MKKIGLRDKVDKNLPESTANRQKDRKQEKKKLKDESKSSNRIIGVLVNETEQNW